MKLTELQRLNKLRFAIAQAATDIQRIANWRDECHMHDEDMGRPFRDFADSEEWDRVEEEARRIKLALATAEPPFETEDSSGANIAIDNPNSTGKCVS
jgi:hypothetical protein